LICPEECLDVGLCLLLLLLLSCWLLLLLLWSQLQTLLSVIAQRCFRLGCAFTLVLQPTLLGLHVPLLSSFCMLLHVTLIRLLPLQVLQFPIIHHIIGNPGPQPQMLEFAKAWGQEQDVRRADSKIPVHVRLLPAARIRTRDDMHLPLSIPKRDLSCYPHVNPRALLHKHVLAH
jgi:hypothetical protein